MKQKLFYEAFTKMYNYGGESLCNHQKEEFYRLLFKEVYAMVEDGMFDNDAIRKITSGNSHIHRRVAKKLVTPEGFEVFRAKIEKSYISYIENKEQILAEVLEIFYADKSIPDDIKSKIKDSLTDTFDYQISRALAGVLICLDYSDYLVRKSKNRFFIIDFMRLSADEPPARYPQFITESPDSVVSDFIGREDELDELSTSVIEKQLNILVSAVGGLGKTELVKNFLRTVVNTETKTSGIEIIAWVPYNNNDIRLSIKQALHMQCDLEEVWLEMQNISAKYGKSLLLVVDNIETVENDEYLKKLSCLQCSIIVTSRQRTLPGFSNVMDLQPLTMDKCRELFYKHYEFNERDNETVNGIIYLTAKLTIMIIFIAKAAHLEEMSLNELYGKLVAKGFKLSDEDVSCEHEKLQNDDTIIRQMCILFSLVKYNDTYKQLLTYASVIPNLEFSFPDAKKWFKVKKNSCLMRLYKMGMLEYHIKDRKHIYWMHSVIAAAIREQQKEKLYDLSRPFVQILSEELNSINTIGMEYKKSYLIPFSWSVYDIMENHWCCEADLTFLSNLFHICFACSNYSLCEHIIEKIITIQNSLENKVYYLDLVYTHRDKVDLLLQFEKIDEALSELALIDNILEENGDLHNKVIISSQYGFTYQKLGEFTKSKKYYLECIDAKSDEYTDNDLSTAYSNISEMLIESGDYSEAYDYIKLAIDIIEKYDKNADYYICYSILAAICTELVSIGYGQFIDEGENSFEKVIEFRKNNLDKNHADLAVVYHDYSLFLLNIDRLDLALKYNEKAELIYFNVFGEHSISRIRNLGTKALILSEKGKYKDAFKIHEQIINITRKLGDNYIIDLATFLFNYGKDLRSIGEIDEAIPKLKECLDIWSQNSEGAIRNFAEAFVCYGECMYVKGDVPSAIDCFENAMKNISEDIYLYMGILDTTASLYLKIDKEDDCINKYIELLEILCEEEISDDEIKFETCENLSNVLKAEDEKMEHIKNCILESAGQNFEIVNYIDNFFEKSTKK